MQGNHEGMLTIKRPDGNIRTAVTVRIRGDMMNLESVDGAPFRTMPHYVKLEGCDKLVSERDVLKMVAGMTGTGAKMAQLWLEEFSENEVREG